MKNYEKVQIPFWSLVKGKTGLCCIYDSWIEKGTSKFKIAHKAAPKTIFLIMQENWKYNLNFENVQSDIPLTTLPDREVKDSFDDLHQVTTA